MASELFETLCFVLDDELERQENVLSVCRAQGEAARSHDIEYLEAKTLALVTLMREAVQAEKMRDDVIRRIAQETGQPETLKSLSDLILLSPDPWKARLEYLQSRLKTVLAETRAIVASNSTVLRSGLTVLTQSIRALEQCVERPVGYDASGFESASSQTPPRMVDQRG